MTQTQYASSTASPISLDIFDSAVSALTAHEVVRRIEFEAGRDKVTFLTNHNLHSLYLMQTDPQFAALYKRDGLTIIDGFPVLLAAKIAVRRGEANRTPRRSHRVGSLDWLAAIDPSTTLERIAVVGATEESNTAAVAVLRDALPVVEIRGWDGDSWHDGRAREVVKGLVAFRPSLVLVGLGMPTQEKFLLDFEKGLPSAVYATVGGAIDQLSGVQIAAPRWLGQLGLEWMWRLVSQPRRMAGRYLVEPLKLVPFAITKYKSRRIRQSR